MSAALAVYEAALRAAAAGTTSVLTLRDDRGDELLVNPAVWCRPWLEGDAGLLAGCTGPTLDVGCGPGRLAGALAARGQTVLGIDISAEAVRQTRLRGASALRRNVFGAVPGDGRWEHVLLADGNIGIGGDPEALLARCRRLLAPGGVVHVEVGAPGSRTWSGHVGLRAGAAGRGTGAAGRGTGAAGRGLGDAFAPMRWAVVGLDGLPAVAEAAGLQVSTGRQEAGRWFATLRVA